MSAALHCLDIARPRLRRAEVERHIAHADGLQDSNLRLDVLERAGQFGRLARRIADARGEPHADRQVVEPPTGDLRQRAECGEFGARVVSGERRGVPPS
jgi:hypothetical protein